MNKQLEICKERKYLLQFEFDKINNSFFRFLKSRIKKLDYLNKEIKQCLELEVKLKTEKIEG